MGNRSRWVTRLIVAGAVLSLFPRKALAEDPESFAAMGLLAGATLHSNTATMAVIGAEATISHYPEDLFEWGIGGFAQVQTMSFDHLRVDAGLQTNYAFVGAELGLYYEAGSEHGGDTTPFAPTAGIHLAPFVSAGFVSAALRMGIPVHPTAKENRYGYDMGLIFTLKAPFRTDGGKM